MPSGCEVLKRTQNRPLGAWALLTILTSSLPPWGCSEPPPSRLRGLPALEQMNVLLIVVDTLGAEHLGCHNPEWTHSPRIDELARQGVLFERAYSPAPWTQPAVASLFTSLTPSDHGLIQLFQRLDPKRPVLAEEMKSRGFATGAVISHSLLARGYGYGRGFDTYDGSPTSGHQGICGQKVTDKTMALLDELAGERFFVFAHYFDPHYNYLHHPDYDRTSSYQGRLEPGMDIIGLRAIRHELEPADVNYLVDLHHEEIAYTDEQIGRLLEHLEELGLTDETLVILTADHGEEFMRHGWLGHTRTLYDELLHVPLIFRLPGKLRSRRLSAPVSLLDVMPTLLDMSLNPPPDLPGQGVSLLDWLTGSPPEASNRSIFAEVSFRPPQNRISRGARDKQAFKASVLQGDWKLIHDVEAGSWELYNLAVDPHELRDEWRDDHPRGGRLRARLLAWEQERVPTWGTETAPTVDVDPETLEELRALGYIH